MNNLRILLALALSFLPLANASAGNGTITTKDAGGVTRTFSIVTDGSGNFIARQVICDQSAAANCAGVNASNQLAIAAASGAFASGALASGSVASGAVASGAFASGSISSGAIAAGAQVDLLTMRGTKNAGTAAANSLLAGGVYNSTPLTLTDTQQASLQTDANGFLKVNVVAGGAGGGAVTLAQTTTTGTGWTSGTSLNATQTIMTGTGAIGVTLQLNQTTTITGGAVTIEGTYDGTNWVTVPIGQVLNPNTLAPLTNPYTLVASTDQPFSVLTQGYVGLRVKLSTAITGSGTVTPISTPIYYDPTTGGILNPTSISVGGIAVSSVAPFPVTQSSDVCTTGAKLNAPFSTSSGGPVSIVALSGSTKVYVCSISAITDTAIKLSFIDGTGGDCASAQHAIWGSATAANGMSLAANGGFTQGSGNGTVGVTAAASALCLLQSGTSLVAGNVTYVQQ